VWAVAAAAAMRLCCWGTLLLGRAAIPSINHFICDHDQAAPNLVRVDLGFLVQCVFEYTEVRGARSSSCADGCSQQRAGRANKDREVA
jgi:hypothetical protein